MDQSDQIMPGEQCVQDVRRMARRTALLYHYFVTILVEHLGEESPGEHAMTQARGGFAIHRTAEQRPVTLDYLWHKSATNPAGVKDDSSKCFHSE